MVLGTPTDEKSPSTGARPLTGSAQCDTELVGSCTPSLHVAATLMVHGAMLYGLSCVSPGGGQSSLPPRPQLPAAKTTVTPASCTMRVAMFVGSFGLYSPVVPHE